MRAPMPPMASTPKLHRVGKVPVPDDANGSVYPDHEDSRHYCNADSGSVCAITHLSRYQLIHKPCAEQEGAHKNEIEEGPIPTHPLNSSVPYRQNQWYQ